MENFSTLDLVWHDIDEALLSFRDKASTHFANYHARQTDKTPQGFLDTANALWEHGGGRNPLACNIVGRRAFIRKSLKGLKRWLKRHPSADILPVTIILPQSYGSDENTVLRIGDLISRARHILSKMSPHYIAAVEMQAMTNERAVTGGKQLCTHVHAVVFGDDIRTRAKKREEATNTRVGALSFGVVPVNVGKRCKSATSLLRCVAYTFRLKPTCKTRYFNPATGEQNLHESAKGDRMIRYERQFELLSRLELREVLFAGGDGRRIKTAALNKACKAVKLTPRRLSDKKICKFWRRWRKRTNTKRFAAPIIIQRRRILRK